MVISPIIIIGAYWAFSAIVGGMPEPEATASIWYRWGYSSLHILAGNVSTAVQSRYTSLGCIPEHEFTLDSVRALPSSQLQNNLDLTVKAGQHQ